MKLIPILVSSLLLGLAASSYALDVKPYTAAALAEAQQGGQPLALLFHANWCPTCRAQDRALDTLKSEQGLDLTVLKVNYDTEKDLKRRFKVNAQSTIVVLKGQEEKKRLVGDSTPEAIRGALKSAL